MGKIINKLGYVSVLIPMLLINCQDQLDKPNDPLPPISLDQGEWVDLSHPFNASTIYWPTDTAGFRLDTVSFGQTEGDYFYAAFGFCSAEHGGTHLDAPIHFADGRNSVDQIPLTQLIGKAIVVDVSEQAANDRDYQVTVEDFRQWEEEYGSLPDGCIILLRTGYGKYWPDRTQYLGTDAQGPEAVPLLHFPGLHPQAAEWLTENRNVKAIGLDTPSIDFGQSTLFETHRKLFQANIPAFENVANLDQLPQTGAWVLALPMQIEGGSGAPLRAVAWIP